MQQTTPSNPGLLKAKEAASVLAVSEKHLYNLAKRGLIPRVVLGSRAVRYRVSDLEALIARATIRGVDRSASRPCRVLQPPLFGTVRSPARIKESIKVY